MADTSPTEFSYTMRTILLMEKDGKYQWRCDDEPYNECPLFGTRSEAQEWIGPVGELKSIVVP